MLSTSLMRAVVRRLRPAWVRRAVLSAGIDPLSPPAEIGLPGGRALMVLAPHPDDESIGCGGLLARWLADGRSATVVVLTDGENGFRNTALTPAERGALRRAEALAAVGALGGAPCVFLGLPDGRLHEARAELSRRLAGEIAAARPDVIALPHAGDRHPDHTAVTPALLDALAAVPADRSPSLLLGYEIWSPVHASGVIDISGAVEAKRAAIAAHRSQTAQRDYADGILALNRYRAVSSQIRGDHAEAYWTGTPRDLARLRAALEV